VPTATARARPDASRFALAAVALSLGFFGLIRLSWIETQVLPFTRGQAALAVGLFGPHRVPAGDAGATARVLRETCDRRRPDRPAHDPPSRSDRGDRGPCRSRDHPHACELLTKLVDEPDELRVRPTRIEPQDLHHALVQGIVVRWQRCAVDLEPGPACAFGQFARLTSMLAHTSVRWLQCDRCDHLFTQPAEASLIPLSR
jgi:hypothetical protein